MKICIFGSALLLIIPGLVFAGGGEAFSCPPEYHGIRGCRILGDDCSRQ